jgi:hypothetical protein
MKTNPSFRIFKLSKLISLGIGIGLVLAAQPIRASVVNNIVITENSSTSLTVTYNGSTSGISISPFTPEGWVITFPSSVQLSPPGNHAWVEPEKPTDPLLCNSFVESNAPNKGFFASEFQSSLTHFADGTVLPDFGTDTSNGGSISVQVFDKGDAAKVPDSGSTFGLLFLSLIGLLGATRLRSAQSA